MDRKSVVMIDRSRLFREGMKHILKESSFDIIADAATFDELPVGIRSVPIDIILVDDTRIGEGPAEFMALVDDLAPNAKTVFLGAAVELPRLSAALAAGADGYLLKDLSAGALLQSLQLVLTGEKVFPTDLALVLVTYRNVRDHSSLGPRQSSPLSDRELEIVAALVNGDSNKLIAIDLCIAEGTVKAHVKALLKKLGLKNRTQAAIWAIENGVSRDLSDFCRPAAGADARR